MNINNRRVNFDKYQSEIDYWDHELSLEGTYPDAIINRSTPAKMHLEFPFFIEKYIQCSVHGYSRVIDVGSGPLSMLAYGAHHKMFDLVCADPLAGIYHDLLAKYNYSIPYPLVCCFGEELSKKFGENQFDLAWMHNAIDHVINPVAVFAELVKICRPGGYIILRMWSREGTAENFCGIHNHDFFVGNDGHLYVQSYNEGVLSPPVEVHSDHVIVIEQPKPTPFVKEDIVIVFRKL